MKLLIVVPLLLLALSFSLFTPTERSYACECAPLYLEPENPEDLDLDLLAREEYLRADVIFTGTVVARTDLYEHQLLVYEVAAERVYKGQPSPTFYVMEGSPCGHYAAVGERYLYYTYESIGPDSRDNGLWDGGICGLTTPLYGELGEWWTTNPDVLGLGMAADSKPQWAYDYKPAVLIELESEAAPVLEAQEPEAKSLADETPEWLLHAVYGSVVGVLLVTLGWFSLRLWPNRAGK